MDESKGDDGTPYRNFDDAELTACTVLRSTRIRMCPISAIVSDREKVKTVHKLKALASIYGGLLFWVGGWDLMSQIQTLLTVEQHVDPVLLQLIILLVGLALSVIADNLYLQGGFDGNYHSPRRFCSFRGGKVLRSLLGLLGQLLLWFNVFSLINVDFIVNSVKEYSHVTVFNIKNHHGKYIVKDFCLISVSFSILFIFGVIFVVTGVQVAET